MARSWYSAGVTEKLPGLNAQHQLSLYSFLPSPDMSDGLLGPDIISKLVLRSIWHFMGSPDDSLDPCWAQGFGGGDANDAVISFMGRRLVVELKWSCLQDIAKTTGWQWKITKRQMAKVDLYILFGHVAFRPEAKNTDQTGLPELLRPAPKLGDHPMVWLHRTRVFIYDKTMFREAESGSRARLPLPPEKLQIVYKNQVASRDDSQEPHKIGVRGGDLAAFVKRLKFCCTNAYMGERSDKINLGGDDAFTKEIPMFRATVPKTKEVYKVDDDGVIDISDD